MPGRTRSLGLGLQSQRVSASPSMEEQLAALDTAGKVISAWVLPDSNPSRDLTLNGANVEGWAAAYGSQKVTLVEVTNRPQWDATLFANKGGVVFDGTASCLTGTGNVTNWPTATADLYMIAAVRQDALVGVAGNRVAFNYGASSEWRYVGRTSGNLPRVSATGTSIVGATAYTGPHTIGAAFDLGGTSTLYLDGVSDGSGATASETLTLTRVRMGAVVDNTPDFFWQGAIVAAAVLNSTATLADFIALEASMRARLA